ncbi:hypothetical protein D8674_008561 [Pyrus ussuriensis x Pyrus communis]|uniref:Uncharacterized protein n=1 Tax=Pyrus ussuriensis x Pyrus communis TaxID=2448454 RepID=A0A5N5HXX8_9ROSA|nr:hypothetical protein D8674_008561 [Pyrus ussuriensis x Pyrus communis]
MVSSFSNPGFPPVHAHPTCLPAMDARLSATLDSFEASMRAALRDTICKAMDSALTAIHKAVNPVLAEIRIDLAQLCRDLALGVKGDSDPASMSSKEAGSIEVGHQKLQNGDGNPLIYSSTIPNHSIPPLLLSSPMLRALASSPVKSQLKEFVAATIPLQHFEKPMPIAMVTTMPFPFSIIVGKTVTLSQLAEQDANVTTYIEGCEDHKSFKLQIICLCMLPSTHTNTTKRRHEASLFSNFTTRKDKWYWIL